MKALEPSVNLKRTQTHTEPRAHRENSARKAKHRQWNIRERVNARDLLRLFPCEHQNARIVASGRGVLS